jgi:predicted nucleic acid-binding protein
MRSYLLDTNVLILQLRRHPDITALLTELIATSGAYISAPTRAEVLAGTKPHEESRTFALLNSVVTISVDAVIADHAGRLIYQYARRGIQVAFPDALIAATALLNELTLVTTNIKHFPMPELQLHPVYP